MLVYQSNTRNLTKEANSSLFGEVSSYQDMMNKIAASSFWEPFGVTVNGLDYLDTLEKMGVDGDTLGDVAGPMFVDCLLTDAAIEATMEKMAGAEGSIIALLEDLEKLAIAGAFRAVAGGLGRSLAGGAKGVKAIGGAYGKARDVLRRRGGIRGIVAGKAGAAEARVVGGARGFFGKRRSAIAATQKEGIKTLQAERTALRNQLEGASAGEAYQIGTNLKSITKRMKRLGKTYARSITKQRKGLAAAGVSRARATKSSVASGRQAAAGAAKSSTASPGAVASAASFRAWKRKNGGSYSDWVNAGRPGAAGAAGAGKRGYTQSKAPKTAPSAPSPQGPPRGAGPQSVKDAPGYRAIYSKWIKGGWKSLSDAEKRKVYVGAGVAFVGQHAVYG
jgi:hypothetical protein